MFQLTKLEIFETAYKQTIIYWEIYQSWKLKVDLLES